MADPTHDLLRVDDVVAAVLGELASTREFSDQSLSKIADVARRFVRFLQLGHDVQLFRDVSPALARQFVEAHTGERAPSLSTAHLRRWVLQVLFRTARSCGVRCIDPTYDLILTPKTGTRARPLLDDEVVVCRSHSERDLLETRLPAAWALAEATARTSEIGHVRVSDVDLSAGVVQLRGHGRYRPRQATPTEWGLAALARRIDVLTDHGLDDPLLVYGGSGSPVSRQAASCMTITRVLELAGLGGVPEVRPLSVAAWAGRRMALDGVSMDEIARRLGMRSLDATSRLIQLDWREPE